MLFIELVKAVLLLGDLIAPARRAVLGAQVITHGLCHLHLLVCQCAGNACKVCWGQVPHAGAGLLAILVHKGEAAYHQVVVRLFALAQVVQFHHLTYRHVDLLSVFQRKVVLLRLAASPLGDVSIATNLFKLFLCRFQQPHAPVKSVADWLVYLFQRRVAQMLKVPPGVHHVIVQQSVYGITGPGAHQIAHQTAALP